MSKQMNPFYSEKREIECQTELDDGYFVDDGQVQEEEVQESLYGLLQLTKRVDENDENEQTSQEGLNPQPVVESLTSVSSSTKKDFTITSKKLFRSTKVITPSKFATQPVDASKWETLSKDYSKKALKATEKRKKPIAKKSKELLYEILGTSPYGSVQNENVTTYQYSESGETNLKTVTQIPMQYLNNSQYQLVSIQHPINASEQVLQLADEPNSPILANQIVHDSHVALTINSTTDGSNQMLPIYEIPITQKQDISIATMQHHSFGSHQSIPIVQLDTENIQSNLSIVQKGATTVNNVLQQKLSTEQVNVFPADDLQTNFSAPTQTSTIQISDIHPNPSLLEISGIQPNPSLLEISDCQISSEHQPSSINDDIPENLSTIHTYTSHKGDLRESSTNCENIQKSSSQNDVCSAKTISTNVVHIDTDTPTRQQQLRTKETMNIDNKNQGKSETTTLDVQKLKETLQNQGKNLDLLTGLISNDKGEVCVNGTPLKFIVVEASKVDQLRNSHVTAVAKVTETVTDAHAKYQHTDNSIIVRRISKKDLDKIESTSMVTKGHEINGTQTRDNNVLEKMVENPNTKPDKLSPNEYHEIIKQANKTIRLQNSENLQKSDKPRKFKCDMCTASFTKSCNLSAHKRIHTNDKRFQCHICNQRFYVAAKLRTHIIIHSDSRPFECDICLKTFRQKSVLKDHLLTHDGKKAFSCELCDKTFTRRSKLELHSKTHDSEKPYKCEYCGRTFAIIYYYRRHVKRHATEKEFKCDICLKTFHLKESYKFHLMTHDESKKKQCNICFKTFIKESQLRQHACPGQVCEIDESEWSCDKCDEVFVNKAQLKIHIKQHNMEAVYKCHICDKLFLHEYLLKRHKVVHTNKKPYRCKLCKAEFGWASSIRTHILKMHKDVVGGQDKLIEIEKNTIEDETVKINKVNDTSPVICKVCNKEIQISNYDSHVKLHLQCPFMCCICLVVFEKENHLIEHLETHKQYEQEKICRTICKICIKDLEESEYTLHSLGHKESVFICHICYKIFDDRQMLQHHNKMHEKQEQEVPTFTCDICKKPLLEAEREKHKLLHFRLPYTCQFCFMNFEKETFMLTHLDVHKGDKPHRCNLCGDKFSTLQALGKHREFHKAEETKPKVCNTCGKRFRHTGDLQMHQRVHTGEKPFKCDNCTETFARKDSLKKHILKFHNKGEKLQCEKCPKEFCDGADLRRHNLYSHIKEKPFDCQLCDRTFIHHYELKKHILFTHGENRPFKCSNCAESFLKRKTLNSHMKKKHPWIEKQSEVINKFVLYEEIENEDLKKEMDDDDIRVTKGEMCLETIKQELISKNNTDVYTGTNEENAEDQLHVDLTNGEISKVELHDDPSYSEEAMDVNTGENKTNTGPAAGIEEAVSEKNPKNINTNICQGSFECQINDTGSTTVVQKEISSMDCQINVPDSQVNEVIENVCQTGQNHLESLMGEEIKENVCQTDQNHSEFVAGEEITENVCQTDQNHSESLTGEEIVKLDNEMYVSDQIKEPDEETDNTISVTSNSTSVPIEIHIQTIENKSSASQDDAVVHRILNIQADQMTLPTWYLDEDSGKIIKIKKSETAENMIDIEIMDDDDVHTVSVSTTADESI